MSQSVTVEELNRRGILLAVLAERYRTQAKRVAANMPSKVLDPEAFIRQEVRVAVLEQIVDDIDSERAQVDKHRENLSVQAVPTGPAIQDSDQWMSPLTGADAEHTAELLRNVQGEVVGVLTPPDAPDAAEFISTPYGSDEFDVQLRRLLEETNGHKAAEVAHATARASSPTEDFIRDSLADIAGDRRADDLAWQTFRNGDG